MEKFQMNFREIQPNLRDYKNETNKQRWACGATVGNRVDSVTVSQRGVTKIERGARRGWSDALKQVVAHAMPPIPCEVAAVAGEATTPSSCIAPKVVLLARSSESEARFGELDGAATVA
uniref:Uncharacterized protein n=1 Tax=Oryza punctata TaxID=4537 RepID=A0A0E0KZ53_ORYPU